MWNQIIKSIGATFFLAAENLGLFIIVIPFSLGVAGFYPGLVTISIAWLFVLAIALLYLEATLSLPDGGNLLSLVEMHLGKGAKWLIAFLFFPLLSYPLQAAYLRYLLPLFQQFLSTLFGFSFSNPTLILLISILLGLLIFWGFLPTLIGNFVMAMGLFVSLFLLAKSGSPYIEHNNLSRHDWTQLFLPIVILFAAAGFQPLVPPIASFLTRNRKALIFILFFGTLIPFATYALMSWLVIGTFSEETFLHLLEEQKDVSLGASLLEKTSWLSPSLALLSTFVTLSFGIVCYYVPMDILMDGFKIPPPQRKGKIRLFATLAVIIPPLFFVPISEKVMNLFLDYILDVDCLILSLLPIIFVWKIRYRHKLPLPRVIPGGKPVLISLLFGLFYLFGLLYLIWFQSLAPLE